MDERDIEVATCGHLTMIHVMEKPGNRWEITRGSRIVATGPGYGTEAIPVATWQALVTAERMEGRR